MSDFVTRAISASEFEHRYLEKFKGEVCPLDEWTYRILDEVFGDVDAFCADREEYDRVAAENPGWPLDADALREKVREALARLSPEYLPSAAKETQGLE